MDKQQTAALFLITPCDKVYQLSHVVKCAFQFGVGTGVGRWTGQRTWTMRTRSSGALQQRLGALIPSFWWSRVLAALLAPSKRATHGLANRSVRLRCCFQVRISKAAMAPGETSVMPCECSR
jgi:hypothetical protein